MTKMPTARTAAANRMTRPTRIARVLGDVLFLLLLTAGQEVAEGGIVAALGLLPVAEEAELPFGEQGDAVADAAGQRDVVGHHDRGDSQLLLDRVHELADGRDRKSTRL